MDKKDLIVGCKLPIRRETARLIITDTVYEEVSELQAVYETGEYLAPWLGEGCKPGYIDKCLTDPELPPDSSCDRKYAEMKTVRQKDSGKIIGFMELYRGWPSTDKLFIPFFYLLPETQGQGYGQEAINWLFSVAKEFGFKKAGLGVHLKNWPALRFWTALGFTTITIIHGDREHSEKTFCLMGLERVL